VQGDCRPEENAVEAPRKTELSLTYFMARHSKINLDDLMEIDHPPGYWLPTSAMGH
jgi:hypothetical protein